LYSNRTTSSVALILAWAVLLAGNVLALQDGEQDGEAAPPIGPLRIEHMITSIEVEGLVRTPAARIIGVLGQRVGEPFDVESFNAGARTCWDVYKVLVAGRNRIPVEGGPLIVRVVDFPVDLEPRFIGNNRFDTDKLREWARIDQRGEIYLHEAAEIKERLLRAYKAKGYHFIEIDIISNDGLDGSAPDVVFELREGPKVRVKSIRVKGNDDLPDRGWGLWRSGLRRLAKMQTKGRGMFRWFGGMFVEDELKADLIAMRGVYRSRGWLDATVELDRLEFTDDRAGVRVHVIVDEGPLWRVGELEVRGVEEVSRGQYEERELLFTEDELDEVLELKPGVPFEEARVQHDRAAMRSFYGERGYIDAGRFANPESSEGWRWIEPEVMEDFENKLVHVRYRIVQGRQRFLREIRFKGNLHTRDKVLRRRMDIEEGEHADLKRIDRSLSRIIGTGYFSDQMSMDHIDPYYVFHETDDEDLVDLEIIANEGRVVDAGLSGGVSSERGIVGQVSLSFKNFDVSKPPRGLGSFFSDVYDKEAFHGNGELLEFDVAPGSQVSQARVRYRHPDLFGTHYDRWSLDTDISIRDRLFRSHDEERFRATMTLSRLFRNDFSIGFGPAYQATELSDLEENIPQTLAESDPDTTFQGIRVVSRLRRLDNRLVPRDGFNLRWNNTLYGGPFGGENDLWKSELFADLYFPLKSIEEQDVFPVLYLGGGASIAKPYDDTEEVHYAERYFLGGSSTLRGFDFRGVGPFDGDYPVGGQNSLRGTAEYRFPLYTTQQRGTSRRIEMFRGILFIEAGVLGSEAFELDLDELRASVGFGFGLSMPLPLTFNFGWPIRDKPEDDLEVFSFRLSLGR